MFVLMPSKPLIKCHSSLLCLPFSPFNFGVYSLLTLMYLHLLLPTVMYPHLLLLTLLYFHLMHYYYILHFSLSIVYPLGLNL